MKWILVLAAAVLATTVTAEIDDNNRFPENLDEDLASRTSRQFFSSSGLVFPGPRSPQNENQRVRPVQSENQRPVAPPNRNTNLQPPKQRRPTQNRPSANPDKEYETPAQKKSTQYDEGSFVPVFAPSANSKPSPNNNAPRPSSGTLFREDSAGEASFQGDRFNNDKPIFPQPSPSNNRYTQSFERPNLNPIPNGPNDRPSFSNEAQSSLRNPEQFPPQDFGPSPFLRPSSPRPERPERPERLERPEPPFSPFTRPDDERTQPNPFGRPSSSNAATSDFQPVRPTPPQSRPVAQSPRPVPLSTTQEFSPLDVPTPNTRPSPTTPLRLQQSQQAPPPQQQRVTRPPTPTLTKPRPSPTPQPRPPQRQEELEEDEDGEEEERYSRPSAPVRQEYTPEKKPSPAPKKPTPKPRPAPPKPQSKPQPVEKERKPASVEEEEEEEEDEVEKPDRLTELLRESKFGCKDKKDGYYADEALDCEVFHYCQDRVRHSWLCPAGAAFHQVHLICMPVGKENICQKSSEFHFVNDYLYKTIDDGTGDNSSQIYADRYYPEGYEPGLSQLDADTLVAPNSLKFKPHNNPQSDQYSKQKQNSPSRPVHQRPPQRIQPQYEEDDYDDEESSILPSFHERPDPRLRPRPYGEESRKVQVTQPPPRVTQRSSKDEATTRPNRPAEAPASSVSPIEEEFDD